MFQWAKTILGLMSAQAKKAWARWSSVIKGERKLLLADLMASAMPLVDSMKNTTLSGQEKREAVVNTLVGIATKHAVVVAGKIAVGEIKALCGLAVEAQVVALKAEEHES